ncbi:MAG: carbohydrate porin [Deltaproteobacteria bacterium]|nr:carbohydrate porin [Deltaproteobacteria bacterium]
MRRTTLGARLLVELPEPAERLSYPVPKRGVGMPANIETDLQNGFPERGSVLPPIRPPKRYFEFKEGLYERLGLKLAFSYQLIALGATGALPAGEILSQGRQTAWAGNLLIEAQWVLYQREKDYPGSLVTAFDWRHTLQNAAQPAFFSLDTGSLWPHDFYYLSWRPWFPVLFYEQGFKKDVFVLRFGNFQPMQFIDFFRFKDPRTSFSGTPFTAPTFINPFGPPGFGIQFDLRPIKDNELYFTGVIHDQNARIEEYSWGEFFTKGDLYYGLEIGYFWKRAPGDFDHLHVDVIYAAGPAQPSPVAALLGVGNEPGWVFKAHGSKQIDRWVVYGNYTFNSSEGGAFGATLADHSVAAGVSFLRPFRINGEWSLGAAWAKPINRTLRDQYGIETYWKVLVAEYFWVTPGLEVIFRPTYNTAKNVLAVGGIKLRLFF